MDKPPTRQGRTAGQNPRIGTTRSRATKNNARKSRRRSALWKTKPATTEFLKTHCLNLALVRPILFRFKIERPDAIFLGSHLAFNSHANKGAGDCASEARC